LGWDLRLEINAKKVWVHEKIAKIVTALIFIEVGSVKLISSTVEAA